MADGLEIEWNGDEILAAMRGSSMEGLELGAEYLLQVSSQQAPHEEGDLERSGDVSKDPAIGAVAVYFDRPYAARQHEDMTLHHDEGRIAKFLEKPMVEDAAIILAIIAKAAGKPLQ